MRRLLGSFLIASIPLLILPGCKSLTEQPAPACVPPTHSVASPAELHQALKSVEAGTVLVLAKGVYHLSEPLVLGPPASGTKDAPVIIRASGKGAVTISGGTVIAGWERYRDGIWQAQAQDGLTFDTLYWRGQRQILARTPNRPRATPRTGGMLYAVTKDADAPKEVLHYDPERCDPSAWKDAPGVRMVVWPDKNWNCDRRNIVGVDLESHTLRIKPPARYSLIRGNRFYVENALAMLDAPGEWFLDHAAGTVYFKTPDGSAPGADVSVPVAKSLLVLQGSTGANNPVRGVIIEGFRFRECSGTAIVLSGAENCDVRTCEITDTGDAGIVLKDTCRNNRIAGCDIAGTGTEGVRIEGERDWEHRLEGRTSGNVITNNHIHHVGMSGNAGGAIDLRPYCGGNVTHDNVISHNEIHDTPRKAIMFGGIRNIVEYNHVHHSNLEQSDTGTIGMCTRDLDERGSSIRYNYVHDTGGYNMVAPGRWEFPNYCWAIYLDDITSGVTVYGNILEGSHRGGLHVHGGQDNLVENNVFVNGIRWQLELNGFGDKVAKGRPWKMKGNRILRNIFAYSGPDTGWIRGNNDLVDGIAESDGNVIWSTGAAPTVNNYRKAPIPFEEWQRKGFDTHSVLADPKFKNAKKGDYRLKSDSPALKLGFKPIPFDKIGLQDTPERFSWPIDDDVKRETPVASNKLPPKPMRMMRQEIPRLTMEPLIDGVLDDFERKGDVDIILNQDHHGDKARPTSRARIRWDDKRIYFGIYNAGDEGKTIVPGTAWGRVDAVEVAIRADGTSADTPILVLRGYTDGTFTIASDGGMTETDCTAARNTIQYGAKVVSDRKWIAEANIPWSAIPGLKGAAGTTPLQFNLTCRKPAGSVWLMWQSTGRHSYGVGPEGLLVPKK